MKEKNIGFVLGFIAGEGHFGINLYARSGKLRASPRFAISAHEDEQELLEELQELVGLGYISPNKSNYAVRWKISSWDEAKKFSEQILEAADDCLFLLSEKYEQFNRWVEFILTYEHPESRSEAKRIVEEVKDMSATHTKRGLSVQEWMERLNYGEDKE